MPFRGDTPPSPTSREKNKHAKTSESKFQVWSHSAANESRKNRAAENL